MHARTDRLAETSTGPIAEQSASAEEGDGKRRRLGDKDLDADQEVLTGAKFEVGAGRTGVVVAEVLTEDESLSDLAVGSGQEFIGASESGELIGVGAGGAEDRAGGDIAGASYMISQMASWMAAFSTLAFWTVPTVSA